MSQHTLRLLRFTYKKLKEKLTVSDSKKLFHEKFPYVIPGLYKRIVDEMLVELNLLNHQSEFIQDDYFCVGLTETFNELTKGYKPEKYLNLLFDALCQSTNFNPDQINEISKRTISEYKNKTTKEISEIIKKSNKSNLFSSRILILGLFKILSNSNDFKNNNDSEQGKIISTVITSLNISTNKAEKDISLYKSSIKRLEQAKSLLAENIASDKKKRG